MCDWTLMHQLPANMTKENAIEVLSLISGWVTEAVNEVVVPAVGRIPLPTTARSSSGPTPPSCSHPSGSPETPVTPCFSTQVECVDYVLESRRIQFASELVEEALQNILKGFAGSASCSRGPTSSSGRNEGFKSKETPQSSVEPPIPYVIDKGRCRKIGPMDIYNVIAEEVIKTADGASTSSKCSPDNVGKMLAKASIQQSSQVLIPQVQSLIMTSMRIQASVSPTAPPQPGMERDEVQANVVSGFVKYSIRELLQEYLELIPLSPQALSYQRNLFSLIYDDMLRQVMGCLSGSPTRAVTLDWLEDEERPKQGKESIIILQPTHFEGDALFDTVKLLLARFTDPHFGRISILSVYCLVRSLLQGIPSSSQDSDDVTDYTKSMTCTVLCALSDMGFTPTEEVTEDPDEFAAERCELLYRNLVQCQGSERNLLEAVKRCDGDVAMLIAEGVTGPISPPPQIVALGKEDASGNKPSTSGTNHPIARMFRFLRKRLRPSRTGSTKQNTGPQPTLEGTSTATQAPKKSVFTRMANRFRTMSCILCKTCAD